MVNDLVTTNEAFFDIVWKEDIKDQIYGYGDIQAIRIVT
jgi:hypothetical protein